MVGRVIRWFFIGLSVLFAVFVISLIVTFVRATGAVNAADAALGTGDVSQIVSSTGDAADATQNLLFRIGQSIPFIGGFFTSLQEQANNLQAGVGNIGANVGNLIGSVASTVEGAIGQLTNPPQ